MFLPIVANVLYTNEVQSLRQYVQHSDIDRYEHIMSVSYLSFLVCRRLGLDYSTAARAGLLHDLFYYDWHENDWSHRPHGYRHPGFAAKNAEALCGPLDKKMLNAIKRHMWPLTVVPPSSAEGLVVSLADKYCAYNELMRCSSKRKRRQFAQEKEKLHVERTAK